MQTKMSYMYAGAHNHAKILAWIIRWYQNYKVSASLC